MRPGRREFKQASLTVAIPQTLPEHMRDRTREITHVFVEPEARRQHLATALMNFICQEADACAMTLILTAHWYEQGGPEDIEHDAGLEDWQPTSGPDESQLVAWYEKFGFIKLQDTPKGTLMARQVREKPRIKPITLAVYRALH